MEVARVIYPVETLGPGKRIGVWTTGCSKRCAHCINPELWEADSKREIPVSQLAASIQLIFQKQTVDGITISGGDPLEQKEELLRLLHELHPLGLDILLYTGYTLEEIEFNLSTAEFKALQKNVSVLIDGRYDHELNDNRCPLRGSTNQVIHFFDVLVKPRYERYCCEQGRQIQNFHYSGGLVSVGIHNREEPIHGDH